MKNRLKIHNKIRTKISAGTAKRPRLVVYRSLNHLFAQLIDDSAGKTLASASSLKLAGPRTQKAAAVGEQIAAAAKEQKIVSAVFDRGGFRFQGSIKTLCESAVKAGLKI